MVKLVRTTPERLYRWVYVRAGQEVTLQGIQAGTYRLLFSTGQAWDSVLNRFACGRANREFDDLLVFEEIQENNATRYTTFSVTLHPVVRGNAPAHQLSDEAFDRLGASESVP